VLQGSCHLQDGNLCTVFWLALLCIHWFTLYILHTWSFTDWWNVVNNFGQMSNLYNCTNRIEHSSCSKVNLLQYNTLMLMYGFVIVKNITSHVALFNAVCCQYLIIQSIGQLSLWCYCISKVPYSQLNTHYSSWMYLFRWTKFSVACWHEIFTRLTCNAQTCSLKRRVYVMCYIFNKIWGHLTKFSGCRQQQERLIIYTGIVTRLAV